MPIPKAFCVCVFFKGTQESFAWLNSKRLTPWASSLAFKNRVRILKMPSQFLGLLVSSLFLFNSLSQKIFLFVSEPGFILCPLTSEGQPNQEMCCILTALPCSVFVFFAEVLKIILPSGESKRYIKLKWILGGHMSPLPRPHHQTTNIW